ncbi:MAG TPA: CheR family methyltransferase [Myxococcaceae bacterium]|nr:CheR family methyltransferase [Myxococcaceae bacterium]
MTPEASADSVVDALVVRASEWIGFRHDALNRAALRRWVGQKVVSGTSLSDLLASSRGDDAAMVASVADAVSVGETFFFRQPEHFHFLRRLIAPSPDAPFRVWSAGCATGEEAYSAAAWFSAAAPEGAKVEVLGTDLLDRNVAAARRGEYGHWSVSRSPLPAEGLLTPMVDGRARVRDAFRPLVRFERHNLLEPLRTEVRYDVIFCRNVLVYFSPEAVEQACAHLTAALAPGGYLVFGTVDVTGVPSGLRRAGPAELNVFTRAEASLPPRKAPAPRAPAPPKTTIRLLPRTVAPPGGRGPSTRPAYRSGPVELHLQALALLEADDVVEARTVLGRLESSAPDYLPGLLELALLDLKSGNAHRAVTRMQRLLRESWALDTDALVNGPEALPVAYYRATAEAFLSGREPER